MKQANRKQAIKQYILNSINSDDYDVPEFQNDRDKLRFLHKTFKSEKGKEIDFKGETLVMSEYLKGAPCCFEIDFEAYEILNQARRLGVLEKPYDVTKESKVLDDWFDFIAIETVMLFRKFKL